MIRPLLFLVAASIALCLMAVLVMPVDAVSTRTFLIDDAAQFSAGELERTQVHSRGSVSIGPELARLGLDEAAVAYSLARAPSGAVYVGTGNDGRIYRLAGEALTPFASTGQLLVSALAVGPDETLFAGTLPEGRIFTVSPTGTLAELARPEGVEHVWALVWDPTRSVLLAATGPAGKVFAIDRQGRIELFYDGEATHVLSLVRDTNGALYAGTSDDALVLRLRGPGQAEVVWDFPGNEITALAVRDGALAVAANDFAEPPRPTATPTKGSNPDPPTTASGPSTRPRPGKGRLWRVDPGGRAEKVYGWDDGHFTSVELAADGTLYAAAGAEGRIVRVNPDRTSATWIDVDERQVLGLDLVGPSPVFVTGDAAAVYRVLPSKPRSATWTSKVLDAQFRARFGELTWRGSGTLEFETRSGNTQEVDASWSEWSQPIAAPGPTHSPAGRFLQVRARFDRDPDAVLHAVTAYYLPQNQRAVVTQVALEPPAAGSDARPEGNTKKKLKWEVDNPDADRLRYRLRFRGETQGLWRELTRDGETLTATDYTWDTGAVPDGYYVVEVAASDELENPRELAMRAATTSEPFLVDNHAPRIEGLSTAGTRVRGRAIDSLGPIGRLETAIDGRDWQPRTPVDDLFDTATESFDWDLGDLGPGTYLVAVRAVDAAGNATTAETTLTIPPPRGR